MNREDLFEDDVAVEPHLMINCVDDCGKSRELQIRVMSDRLVKDFKTTLAERTDVKKPKQTQFMKEKFCIFLFLFIVTEINHKSHK